MNPSYAHVLELVRQRPWGILPNVLATIREIVNLHVRGERLSEVEIRERVASAQAQMGDRGGQQSAAGVAILPLYGVIFPKSSLMTELSGATSVQGFMRMFRNALVDTEVKAIVIDVDSPGGLTDLVPEAAAEIRAARGKKPIVAVANTTMASCAYWLASQADEVVASPSSIVGSIGVYAEHYDLSVAYELEGIAHTYIAAGKFKVEGNEFEPLGDEAKRHVQELVDDAYGMFVGDVAKARNAKPDDVRNGFGQGRVLTARMAVAEGLADRVDTLDATVKRMVWVAARQKPVEAMRGLAEFERAGGLIHDDGTVTVPAGYTGMFPEVAESDYGPDAVPLEFLQANLRVLNNTIGDIQAAEAADAEFDFESEHIARRRAPA